MCRREISHVNVVADAGSVLGVVVSTENRDVRPEFCRRLQHKGDKVRLGVMLLTDLALGVSSGGVEVAKRHSSDPVRRTGIPQYHLAHQLGTAVRIGRPLRLGLADRKARRHTVGRTAAGEDHGPHVIGLHGLDQGQHARDVVAIVACRVSIRLTDISESRKIHDGFRSVSAHYGSERCRVVDVSQLEIAPLHRPLMADIEIVVDDRCMTRFSQSFAGVRTDIPSSSRNQYAHGQDAP